MSHHKFAYLVSLLLLIASPAFADRVQSDFDGDGTSEAVTISESNGALAWSTTLSGTDTASDLGSIGVLGDNAIMCDWLGEGKPQIGVVSVNSSTGELDWKIKDSDGVEHSVSFGDSGNTALSGADFDGDGIADAAVINSKGAKHLWEIQTSLFSATVPASTTFRLGRKAETPFFMNVEGTQDWVGTFRKRGALGYLIRLKNVVTGTQRLVRGSASLGSGKLQPVPLASASGVDKILFVTKGSSSTALVILDLDGTTSSATIQATGDVLVGDFLSDDGEEVAVSAEDGFYVYSPSTSQTTQLDALSGIAVDEVNINKTTAASRDPLFNPTDPGDETPTVPVGGLADVCASYTAIGAGQMLIKSEISKHINPGDARATGYTFICGSQCTAKLNKSDFFYANGAYAGSVGYYGRFSGNNKPRLYGAAGGAPQHFASTIARTARTIGNGKLYMQVSSASTGSATSCKEFNPTGRNGSL